MNINIFAQKNSDTNVPCININTSQNVLSKIMPIAMMTAGSIGTIVSLRLPPSKAKMLLCSMSSIVTAYGLAALYSQPITNDDEMIHYIRNRLDQDMMMGKFSGKKIDMFPYYGSDLTYGEVQNLSPKAVIEQKTIQAKRYNDLFKLITQNARETKIAKVIQILRCLGASAENAYRAILDTMSYKNWWIANELSTKYPKLTSPLLRKETFIETACQLLKQVYNIWETPLNFDQLSKFWDRAEPAIDPSGEAEVFYNEIKECIGAQGLNVLEEPVFQLFRVHAGY